MHPPSGPRIQRRAGGIGAVRTCSHRSPNQGSPAAPSRSRHRLRPNKFRTLADSRATVLLSPRFWCLKEVADKARGNHRVAASEANRSYSVGGRGLSVIAEVLQLERGSQRTAASMRAAATEVVVELRSPPQRLFAESPRQSIRDNYLRFRLEPGPAIAIAARLSVRLMNSRAFSESIPCWKSSVVLNPRTIASSATQWQATTPCSPARPLLRRRGRWLIPFSSGIIVAVAYQPAGWGPEQADALLRPGERWHNPQDNRSSSCLLHRRPAGGTQAPYSGQSDDDRARTLCADQQAGPPSGARSRADQTPAVFGEACR